MTAVASEQLCHDLHFLSGWEGSDCTWVDHEVLNVPVFESMVNDILTVAPAYDIHFLLDRLPHRVQDDGDYYFGMWKGESGWTIGYGTAEGEFCYYGEDETELFALANSCEDAAAKLTIALFKAGVLEKQS